MEGLGIDFNKGGAVLSAARKVVDFETIAQNGLVNLATVVGTDEMYPAKGTELYLPSTIGSVTKYEDAYHQSNFAALDTVSFLQATDYEDVIYQRIDRIILEPVRFTGSYLQINAVFEAEDGTTIGINSEA